MIFVTSLDGVKTEPITQFGDFKIDQDVDGKLTLSMKCYNNIFNPGYDILSSQSVITAFGYEFRVHQYNEGSFKTITATSTFFDLSKVRKLDILGGTATLVSRISWCLQGTGWTATFDDDVRYISEFIENFGNDNIIKLIEKCREVYDVEFMINEDFNIHFAKQIGGDNDFQYRYKHNVSDVKLVEDTTDLYTVIRGTGKNGIEATYISPNASVFGALEKEPATNEEMETESQLLQWLAKQINDVPKLSIESTIPELTNRDTGETVWLIYEPMGLTIQTRITKQTKKIINGELVTSSVTFGNIVPKNYVDLFVERVIQIDENDKLYRSRIEQTNKYIILEVERIDESLGRIEIYADQIRQSVTDLRTDAFAAITIEADQIRSEVQGAVTTLNTTINNKATAITTAYRSEIQQSATAINQNVSGMIATVNDDISTVETAVSNLRVDLNGITSTVSNNYTTLNNKLNTQETRISTAEQKITPTAITNTVTSSTTFTNLNNKVNSNETRIDTAEQKITSTAIINTVTGSSTYQQDTIHKGTSAPTTNLVVGRLWLDTWYTPNRLKRYNGYSWVDASAYDVSQISGALSATQASATYATKDSITSFVKSGDVMSIVHQNASSITLSAQNINFNSTTTFGTGTVKWKGNIETDSNITVGNNLYLGNQYSSAYKGIYFNSGANIQGGTGDIGKGISLNCQSLDVTQASFINLATYATNTGYVKSYTAGLEITRNSGDNTKLAVKVNGTYIGDIKMV